MTAISAVRKNQPLPPNPFREDLDASFHAAYEKCLRHEEAAQLSKRGAMTKTKEEQYTKEIVYGRCLGYLLTETSHTNGKRMVSDDIIKCDGQREKMNELAETYINHLIHLWGNASPLRIPEPSVVRRDRDSLGLIVPAPEDHRAAKRAMSLSVRLHSDIAKASWKALKRDNYRCMFTGCVESAAWNVLESKQDGPANTYLIRTMLPLRGLTTTEIIFTSSDPALELPDRRYLKLHAAICRVAHMSGVAEYMDKHDRDLEELSVLAPDGSSAELFTAHPQQRCVLAY
ncbi:hypothetical protein FA13DRAFT_1815454 [Coprinellus micaceus]|uniref:HNH nuclease domain-containing protein n=1 Tax=Coprinellus micaceus TaxID=71717 RepID=A0A4Y7T5W9_COPMI|nr:hypothetical protein FA13DRAFT_1815454 [Coprinellus micaceus]